MKTRKPLLVDSDVIIDFLRGRPQAAAILEKHSDRIILSAIVVAEVYAGARNDDERAILDRLLSLFRIVSVSPSIARAGGIYRQQYGRSHGVGMADAVIAATVREEGAELVTCNVKHYPMFPSLKPAYRKA